MHHLKNRPKDCSIFVITPYKPGTLLIVFPIEESASVILHCRDYSVFVHNIKKTSENKFTGTVFGVEPPVEKPMDIREGDIVSFTESQVFSTSKNVL